MWSVMVEDAKAIDVELPSIYGNINDAIREANRQVLDCDYKYACVLKDKKIKLTIWSWDTLGEYIRNSPKRLIETTNVMVTDEEVIIRVKYSVAWSKSEVEVLLLNRNKGRWGELDGGPIYNAENFSEFAETALWFASVGDNFNLIARRDLA